MINQMLQSLGAGAAAVILAAFAGGIAFVALAYAVFALLHHFISPAGSAAITAGIFAVVAAGLAMIVPKAAPKKQDIAALKPKLDQRTLAIATEAGVAALGLAGDFMVNRRIKNQEKLVRNRLRADRFASVVDPAAPDPREVALIKARRREEKALKSQNRAEKSRKRAEKKLRTVRLKRLTHH